MIDNQDLWEAIVRTSRRLDEAIDKYEKEGVELARMEKEYNVLLRQKSLIDKDAGVPVTLIAQTMRGDPEVAEKRQARDVQEAMYLAMGERINSLKLQLRIINEQAKREWSDRPDYDRG